MSEVERVLPIHNELGEAPLWDAVQQTLYWVDFPRSLIYRFTPASGSLETFMVGARAVGLGLRAGGGLIVASADALATWDAAQPAWRPFYRLPGWTMRRRFNDAAVDPAGRFWVGVIDPDGGAGELRRLDADRSLRMLDRGFLVANGIGWSLNRRTMYFTDSFRHAIYAYNYDVASGEIANRRVFALTPPDEGVPDGLTVDCEGGVWSVRCRGGKVVRYDPAGRVEREIALPVGCPTSCIFGGAGLDELYVTSSWGLVPTERRDHEPWAGDLFRLRPGVRGVAEPEYLG